MKKVLSFIAVVIAVSMAAYVVGDTLGKSLYTSVFSVEDLNTETIVNETSTDVKLSIESDITVPQIGSTYMLKLRYANQMESTIKKMELNTLILDAHGEIVEKFTNNSAIDMGGNAYKSITIPNEPGKTFTITCDGKGLICNAVSVTIPSSEDDNIATISVSDDAISDPLLSNNKIEETDKDHDESINDEVYEPIVKDLNEIKNEVDVDSREIDFEIISINFENQGDKIKVSFEYRQNDVYETTRNLQYKYTVKNSEYDQSLITDIGERTYKVGEIYVASFYIAKERVNSEIIVELDPQTQINDPNRKNNLFKYTPENNGQSDLKINKLSSKINDDGNIKLYIEYQYIGDEQLDASDLSIKVNLPYLDESYIFSDIKDGYLEINEIASYVAILPLKTQNQKVIVEIDPENIYKDEYKGNNTYNDVLEGIASEAYSDLKLLNTAAKMVENDSKIKIYTEYLLEGEKNIEEPVGMRFIDTESGEGILNIENFNSSTIIPDSVYSTVNYLPSEYRGKIIKIEINREITINDPNLANNAVYIKLP